MAKLFYSAWNPNQRSKELVSIADSIITEYQKQGYTLTLRQLYYQFVARDIIENTERSYKNLGVLVTKAREAGMISWTGIEDRNRSHNSFWFEEDEEKVIENLPNYIRFDKWARQPCYIEVWVEKEALGNVISRACNPLLLPHMSCKGYLSASEAWRSGVRFAEQLSNGKQCVLLHLGDHDPSGIDMTRDNKSRVDLYSRMPGEVKVIRLALNRDQVDQYSPPPNPTKLTDKRARQYISQFGHTSWELDALEPQVIQDLIENAVHPYIDWDSWNDIREQEEAKERLLAKLHKKWPDIKNSLTEN